MAVIKRFTYLMRSHDYAVVTQNTNVMFRRLARYFHDASWKYLANRRNITFVFCVSLRHENADTIRKLNV